MIFILDKLLITVFIYLGLIEGNKGFENVLFVHLLVWFVVCLIFIINIEKYKEDKPKSRSKFYFNNFFLITIIYILSYYECHGMAGIVLFQLFTIHLIFNINKEDKNNEAGE